MNKSLLLVLLGIGIGIMLAPDKGSATLRKMKDRFNDLKDQAEDKMSDLADNARDSFDSAKSRVKSVLD